MCGISGYFSAQGIFNINDLRKANDSMQHRGPDAGNEIIMDAVGLAHRRLSIIDLSDSANQPMQSACGRYTMVFNGEIYNYIEIKKEIQQAQPGLVFKTSSDTEVILEAYALWKNDFVHRLNGMFAIAIYDQQERELVLFRDRMGIKPVYYYYDNHQFFFASELKAISALQPKIKLTLNRRAVPYYFHLGYIPEPHSIYEQVYKMPAGSMVCINHSNKTLEQYWNAADKITHEVVHDEQQAKKQLNDLLISSVKYRLISDVPFGTFLSGGIDSSTVTAIASAVAQKPINTFSIGFNEEKYSESVYAAEVAKHLNTNHHAFNVTEKDALELVVRLPEIYDEPFADTSAIPTLLVSKLARKYVTMTLSGDGGDELFMGYGAYQWARRLQNPLLMHLRNPVSYILSKGNNRMQRVAQLLKAVGGSNHMSNLFSQEQQLFGSRELSELLSHDIAVPTLFYHEPKHFARQLSETERQAFFDLNTYLKDDLLVKVDRATMHHSLETRVPLLDYRIVTFALNLDEHLKLRGKTMKYLLKQVLYEYLPPSLFDRPKKGFSIPLHKWLKTDLRDFVDKYLNKTMCERYGIIQWNYAQQIYNNFYVHQLEHFYNRVWLIASFHHFMETNYRQ